MGRSGPYSRAEPVRPTKAAVPLVQTRAVAEAKAKATAEAEALPTAEVSPRVGAKAAAKPKAKARASAATRTTLRQQTADLWRRPEITEEELAEMKREYRDDVAKNLVEVCSLHEAYPEWRDSRIEKDRLGKNVVREQTEEGHIATFAELERHKPGSYPPHTPTFADTVLDLLRDMKTRRTRIVHDAIKEAITPEGWVSVTALITALQDEIPGGRLSVERLISLVRDDRYQRMQMWVTLLRLLDRNRFDSECFTHIRAVSGHSSETGVDPRALFTERQRFDRVDTARNYGGPSNVYYYTNMASLMRIRTEGGIAPDHASYGPRSKKYIYCLPVHIFHDACPEEGKYLVGTKHKEEMDIQITLDFKMIMKDKLECFYTHDGYIAIDCEMLGNMYIKQTVGLKTSLLWYLRQFDIHDRFWSAPVPAVSPEDTRSDRTVADEPCFVCNSSMWLGTVTCFQCNCPFVYESAFPDFDAQTAGTIEHNFIQELTPEFKNKAKVCIGVARRLVGTSFNIQYGIALPSTTMTSKKAFTWRRGMGSQGERHDKWWLRIHNKDLANGVTEFEDIMERINKDKQWRTKLARKVLTCSVNFAPAQVLLSKYCRHAYLKAIEYGEVTYDAAGHKDKDVARELVGTVSR